jgi:hypothetical protein
MGFNPDFIGLKSLLKPGDAGVVVQFGKKNHRAVRELPDCDITYFK